MESLGCGEGPLRKVLGTPQDAEAIADAEALVFFEKALKAIKDDIENACATFEHNFKNVADGPVKRWEFFELIMKGHRMAQLVAHLWHKANRSFSGCGELYHFRPVHYSSLRPPADSAVERLTGNTNGDNSSLVS
jgi:hypothetical protein